MIAQNILEIYANLQRKYFENFSAFLKIIIHKFFVGIYKFNICCKISLQESYYLIDMYLLINFFRQSNLISQYSQRVKC